MCDSRRLDLVSTSLTAASIASCCLCSRVRSFCSSSFLSAFTASNSADSLSFSALPSLDSSRIFFLSSEISPFLVESIAEVDSRFFCLSLSCLSNSSECCRSISRSLLTISSSATMEMSSLEQETGRLSFFCEHRKYLGTSDNSGELSGLNRSVLMGASKSPSRMGSPKTLRTGVLNIFKYLNALTTSPRPAIATEASIVSSSILKMMATSWTHLRMGLRRNS
mmetsp:Transcript_21852/g.39840  ORF Transcript_21852/g.39840 Transcript_21852/m.39840 type:complete len:223 (+) Transcript_21852:390-1058(+)